MKFSPLLFVFLGLILPFRDISLEKQVASMSEQIFSRSHKEFHPYIKGEIPSKAGQNMELKLNMEPRRLLPPEPRQCL